MPDSALDAVPLPEKRTEKTARYGSDPLPPDGLSVIFAFSYAIPR